MNNGKTDRVRFSFILREIGYKRRQTTSRDSREKSRPEMISKNAVVRKKVFQRRSTAQHSVRIQKTRKDKRNVLKRREDTDTCLGKKNLKHFS